MTEICFYVPCLNEEKNIKNSLKTIFDSCLICNISNFEIIIFKNDHHTILHYVQTNNLKFMLN
jgi:glycosyltransferase involved in cell wall biosynthesis